MKLLSYVKSLFPRLQRDDVLEDIRITREELTSSVIPAYQAAAAFFKTSKFKSAAAKSMQNTFNRNFILKGAKRQDSLVSDIAFNFTNVLENLNHVEKQIDSLFSRDIIKDGLTARKALLLRAADHINFIARYSVDLLNLIYIVEAEARATELESEFGMSNKLRENVEKNIFIFARIYSTYAVDPKEFVDLLGAMPEVVVNHQTEEAVINMYKEHQVDPLSIQLADGFQGNPIYHIGLILSEYQANRIKAQQDKKKQLELQLLHLRMLDQDEPSPDLEKQIQYLQKRIEDLEDKLRKAA